MSYANLTNKTDGVTPAAGDNKDDGVVGTDADDAGYQQNIDPGSIKAGTSSGYSGGVTPLKLGDPRFA